MANEPFSFTEEDVKELTAMIKEHAKVKRGPPETFCQVWPEAKNGLQLLSTFIGTIPGVGPFARVAIGIVIAAGDAASSAVCKK